MSRNGLPSFPRIEGVWFKFIPSFDRYAVSTNGHVWHTGKTESGGMVWRKINPIRYGPNGERAVMIQFPNGRGFAPFKVRELMKLFDEPEKQI